ncbi:MAG: ABC transporter ATP-binding protein [Candidatus Sumerlaeales bacterium]|nr:ABC transporter ATP-binding protein [Candidatus Sumerlaeales bacterium]
MNEETKVAALVELRGVTKVYGEGESEVRALGGVDMTIHDGEFVSIMGSSGSGKSTCLNVLGCLDVPTDGQYYFRGLEVGRLNGDQLALLRRYYLGFVFQGFNLLNRTTAVENVELPLVYRRVGKRERRELAMEALADVGLADRAFHTQAELSGGQQQRVAIARAIVTRPQLLLADEPTGNLDKARKREIMNLLRSLNQERHITIAMVTHEPGMNEFVTRIVEFSDGQIVNDYAGGNDVSVPEDSYSSGVYKI